MLENMWESLGDAFIHPNDKKVLEQYKNKLVDDRHVHDDLIPFPYFGNPEKAEVYLLVSNPGFNAANRDEHKDPAFAKAFRDSLTHQTLHPYLAPELNEQKATKGYEWWQARLSDVFKAFDPSQYRDIAERLMCVQLFPYHTKKFPESVARHLPTQQYALDIVRQAINSEKKKEIVVLRAPWRDWLKQEIKTDDFSNHDFISVVKFQGQRKPLVSTREGWLTQAQFDRIICRLRKALGA